jgi:hypothetical protein
MADQELLVVFNTDEREKHEIYSTLNPNLRQEHDEMRLIFSYAPGVGVEPVASPCNTLSKLTVERRGDVLCTRVVLGPAGFAIYGSDKSTVAGTP